MHQGFFSWFKLISPGFDGMPDRSLSRRYFWIWAWVEGKTVITLSTIFDLTLDSSLVRNSTRNNNTITMEMVDEVWRAFIRCSQSPIGAKKSLEHLRIKWKLSVKN